MTTNRKPGRPAQPPAVLTDRQRRTALTYQKAKRQATADVEAAEAALVKALNGWGHTQLEAAAQTIGITVRTLYRLRRKHGGHGRLHPIPTDRRPTP